MAHDHTHTAEQMLTSHGLRKTGFRLEVLEILRKHEGNAISSHMIEENLGEFDRITLYRTLKSFEEKGVVHIAVDGSGTSRYALCQHNCGAEGHYDSHAHFHCDQCGTTSCLDDMPEKITSLIPKTYQVKAVQITYSGVCPSCA